MNKKILVTGAAGFLGQHLVCELANRGYEVLSLSRKHDGFYMQAPGTLVIGDCQDQRLVERLLSEYEIPNIIHLAAQTQVSVGLSNPESVIRENINATLSVLEAARRQKASRVIIASTDKVYGTKVGAYVEESALSERTPYGVSKACADVIAQTYIQTYGMSIGITRCGNLYGPGHLNWSTLIPGTIRRMLRDESTVLRFGGRATRDFLFVRDACAAYVKLLESRETGAFNFSGGRSLTIAAIAAKIATLLGKSTDLIKIEEGGVGEICNQALNCELAHRLLDWHPKVGFDEGLKETVEWYKAHLMTESTLSVSCSSETRSG